MRAIRAIGLLCLIHAVNAALNSFIGSEDSRNVIANTFLVEFPISKGEEDGKHHIINHLTKTKKYGADTLTFHTSTRTGLFHGHSFHVAGGVEEHDILSIPEAIAAYKVLIFPSHNFILYNSLFFFLLL